MAFTVTSNYAGKAAGFYISAALKEATSLDHLTVLQNIKYKENLQKVAGSDLVRNADCNFTDHGTLVGIPINSEFIKFANLPKNNPMGVIKANRSVNL